MKTLRFIFAAICVIALIGIATGRIWHLGTLAVCAMMVLATTEEEEEDSTGWR